MGVSSQCEVELAQPDARIRISRIQYLGLVRIEFKKSQSKFFTHFVNGLAAWFLHHVAHASDV